MKRTRFLNELTKNINQIKVIAKSIYGTDKKSLKGWVQYTKIAFPGKSPVVIDLTKNPNLYESL